MAQHEKYEHLFAEDPIGAFQKIKDDYIRYFAHAYKINNKELNQERIEQLRLHDNCYKEPYLEILPEYVAAEGLSSIDDLGKQMSEAFGDPKVSQAFFSKFIKAGLMNYIPYGHQVGMLEKAFAKGHNVVITSGTGSGKTESFLLPLFAQIFKEAMTWDKPRGKNLQWFNAKPTAYKPCQRDGESRHAAVRALVLYPMNALVEDQMARLRKALDSDEVRAYFDSDEGLKGNRIYFGRYTGSTLATKSYSLIKNNAGTAEQAAAKAKVARGLQELHERYHNIKKYYEKLSDEEKKEKSDCLFVSTRLEDTVRTSEMVTRWDMQETPPDIMITNTSMLSIMLMRQAEETIWSKTKSWLEEDPSHVFHLVIDELHLYRGTSGSEVACLLKMLLRTIGLQPIIEKNGKKIPNPQLRILASSASLGDIVASQKFLQEFFGVYNEDHTDSFDIQPGSDYIPLADTNPLDYSKFKIFDTSFVNMTDEEKRREMDKFAQQMGLSTAVDFVRHYEHTIFADIRKQLKCNDDGSLRPICYTELFKSDHALFDSEASLRGFLIFRGYVDHLKEDNGKLLRHKLPRFRFHQFFKYIEGLWGELHAPTAEVQSPVTNLCYMPNEVGEHKRKVLELLRCECCGELYIGGNRKQDGSGTYMTLNYPDLERIPNFNPTPMVQNKSFQEYTLFWPEKHALHSQGIDVSHDGQDHLALLENGATAYSQTHARACWTPCFLNVMTGKLEDKTPVASDYSNWIEGYRLAYALNPNDKQRPDLSALQAMPCCCPKCGQNYAQRIYAKSPIRSFRTGIDRMNQLLSKELIYQLSEKSDKLIGFSDSRDDAAKQAYGIELEQYRDMVRFLFIECARDQLNSVDEIAEFALSRKDSLKDFTSYKRFISDIEKRFPMIENAVNIAESAINGEELSPYKNPIINLQRFVGRPNSLDGVLVQKLVKLGINPAGVSYDAQFVDENNQQHWSEAFDFETGTINHNTSVQYVNKVSDTLKSIVYSCTFGKYMGVSILDSGIGYLCCQRSEQIENSDSYKKLDSLLPHEVTNVYDFVDAYIRILGDNYRYTDPQYAMSAEDKGSYNDFSSVMKKPVREFSKYYGLDEHTLGNALFDFLQEHVSGNATKLIFEKLALKLVDGNDTYYECPCCHRIHLNKGFGFCTNTNCLQHFDDATLLSGKVKDLWKHYISYDINVEPKKPRRLHTEELTGQTDNIQDRLLEFKDLILLDQQHELYRKGYELTKSIDMVNVTTTMEVGVDIGSLQAIFQGNMSPTRYNYQQRVGRGGRRGQAYSLAVTFCRGRSHDVYYYYTASEDMVGAVPVAPTLSLSPYQDVNEQGIVVYKMKRAIMKRVVVKTLFREALGHSAFDYELIDNAGEFGRVRDWSSQNRQFVVDWIQNNPSKLDDILDLYFGQFNENGCIADDIEALKIWLQKDLILEVDKIVDRCPNTERGLAQYMAECGYLPMYGLPSDLRMFYHGFNRKNNEMRSISRQTEMSISDFAPGIEKTKDKGKYRVEGLTVPMSGRVESRQKVKFNVLGEIEDALAERYIVSYSNQSYVIQDVVNADRSSDATTTAKNLKANEHLLVIPYAYRSYKLDGNQGTPIENNERRSSFSHCTIFAKDNTVGTQNSKQVGNVKISAYGQGLQDDAEVWHINTNNNNFFRGRYASIRPYPSDDHDEPRANFMFFNSDGSCINDPSSMHIAIGSKKPTEMIKLELLSSNANLDLNLKTGNRAAIRAAFYSAAFIIQRVLADKLDVQPDEIEISEKQDGEYPVMYLNDALPNGAGLVSYLYENDNFKNLLQSIVRFETGFMKSLIADEHRHMCTTACQKCIKTYNNRGFHHVLDWRLGVGIINLMLDKNYDFGFSSDNLKQYYELSDQVDLRDIAASKLSQSFNKVIDHVCYVKEDRGHFGVVTKCASIIYHPLWNKQRLLEKLGLEDKEYTSVRWYNTFKLLRSDLVDDKMGEHEMIDLSPAPCMPDDNDDQQETKSTSTAVSRFPNGIVRGVTL